MKRCRSGPDRDGLPVGDLRLADVASTLNARFMRSTMISRCSSPMPEMTVCPVSSSVRTRNVGSASDSRPSGSTSSLRRSSTSARSPHRRPLGNVIASSPIGSIDPAAYVGGPRLIRCRRDVAANISGFLALFACIWTSGRCAPCSWVGLSTVSPVLTEPEYTRKNVSLPT